MEAARDEKQEKGDGVAPGTETSVRRRRGALLIFQSLDGNEAIMVSDDVKMLIECFWLLTGTA